MPRPASMAAGPAVASRLLDERRRILNLCVKSCRTRRYGLCAHRICRCRHQRGSQQRSSKFLHADLRFRCKKKRLCRKASATYQPFQAGATSSCRHEHALASARQFCTDRRHRFMRSATAIKATSQRPWKRCSTCFEVICGQPEGTLLLPRQPMTC